MAASTEVSTRMRIGYVLVVVTGIAAAAWYMNRPVWELQNIVGVSGTVESNVLDVAWYRVAATAGRRCVTERRATR